MLSVTDILKILDKIPVWQTLSQLPKKVEALETRVATLEAALAAPPAKAGPKCPLCGEALKVTKVEPHPQFHHFGHQLHTLTCTCGHAEERKVIPG